MVRVDALSTQVQCHQRHGGSDIEPVGEAVIAGRREGVRSNMERQRFDIEWKRLIPKLARDRNQSAIPQIAPVERGEADALIAEDKGRLIDACGQRSFDKEGSET